VAGWHPSDRLRYIGAVSTAMVGMLWQGKRYRCCQGQAATTPCGWMGAGAISPPSLAWQYRGLILTAQGDPAAALVAYGRTLLLEPDDSRTLLHECEAHLALANYDNAIASCAAALAGNGNWGPTAPALAWLNQGIAEFEQEDYIDAIAALDRAVDLDPLLTLAWAYQGRVLAS
jgi:tetratricopeptide (TPR) repeat protein